MKKALAMILALAMALSLLAGCNSGTPDESGSSASPSSQTGGEVSTQPKVLNVGVSADISSLSPFIGTAQGQLYSIFGTVYQYLFYRNEFAADTAYPMIGKSYTESDDGLTLTVELFDYVKDSAGNDITAEDVVFSYNTADATGLYSRYFAYIDSITAVNDLTVEFKFNTTKLGNSIDMMCIVPIVDSEAYDEDAFLTNPIGTGPYVVKDYASGSYLTLAKNENYWQTDASQNHLDSSLNADEITFKIILETAQMAIMLETGEIDLASKMDYTEMSFFTNSDGSAMDGYYYVKVPSNLVTSLTFNLSDSSVLSNLALRQAIAYAINNEELVTGVLGGAGSTVSTWGTSVYADYNSKWDSEDYYNYNVELAKEKLAEAGYGENEVTVRIMFENNSYRQKAAEMIQAYLLEIGVQTDIRAYDAALYSTYRTDFDEWDILIDNQANSTAIASIWSTFGTTNYTVLNGVNVNLCGVPDTELDGLIARAVALDGHTADDVDAVHYYIKDNVMIYGLWAEDVYAVAQDGVTSIAMNSKLYTQANRCELSDDYVSNAK